MYLLRSYLRFFEQSNGVYMSTAVDVAEYNVRAALHELREGGTYASRDVEMAPKVQGVTTVEDLAGAAEKRGGGGGGSGSGGGGEGESGTERDEGTSGVGTGASGEGRGEVEGVEDALAACGVDGVGRVGGDSGGADGDHAGGEGKAGAEEAARETALDAAMWARLSRVRVSFLTGDLGRALARPDVAGRASVVTVGRNDLHALKGKGIARVLGDSGVVAVESAKVSGSWSSMGWQAGVWACAGQQWSPVTDSPLSSVAHACLYARACSLQLRQTACLAQSRLACAYSTCWRSRVSKRTRTRPTWCSWRTGRAWRPFPETWLPRMGRSCYGARAGHSDRPGWVGEGTPCHVL